MTFRRFLFSALAIALSTQAKAITGLQPVVIVSTGADGQVHDVQVRVVEAAREGAPVEATKPIYVIQNTLEKRPEFEKVQLTSENLVTNRAPLPLREQDIKHGIVKRELLLARPAAPNEDLAGYIAYAPSSQIGYVKTLEKDTTWIAPGQYVIASYEIDQGPRRFEVIAGSGTGRHVLLVPRGQTPAEIAARHDEFLVRLDEYTRTHHSPGEILVGSFSGMSSQQIEQTLAQSNALRCSTLFALHIN